MVSVQSASALIAEARGELMVLLQENDNANGFASPEWADETYPAYECLGDALTHLDQAAQF